MTTLFEALKAKSWLLSNDEARPAKLMMKSYYKNNEMIFNYYYYRGDSDTKFNHWSLSQGRAWKTFYEEAATKAKRTQDALDIAIADFVAWPIINNNLITDYTPQERLNLFIICYGTTYTRNTIESIRQTNEVHTVEMTAVLHEKRTATSWKWKNKNPLLDLYLFKLADTYGPVVIKKPFVRTDNKPLYTKAKEAWGIWEDLYYGDESRYNEVDV